MTQICYDREVIEFALAHIYTLRACEKEGINPFRIIMDEKITHYGHELTEGEAKGMTLVLTYAMSFSGNGIYKMAEGYESKHNRLHIQANDMYKYEKNTFEAIMSHLRFYITSMNEVLN